MIELSQEQEPTYSEMFKIRSAYQKGFEHGAKQSPPRQPLTDEQIKNVFGVGYVAKEFVEFVRAIEAAHGIKGEA